MGTHPGAQDNHFNYRNRALISMILCFPLGIFALKYSFKVSECTDILCAMYNNTIINYITVLYPNHMHAYNYAAIHPCTNHKECMHLGSPPLSEIEVIGWSFEK